MSTGSAGHSKRAAQAVIVVAVALMLSGCAAMSLFKSHKDEPGANEPYPKLGSVPERPEAAESAEDRRKIAEGLLADRTQVQYTDEALRGGTEPSAPPPPPPIAEAAPTTATASTAEAPQAASDESTGATQSLDEEESRPGFFGRLFGSKKKQKNEASSAESTGAAPPVQPTEAVSTEAPPAAATSVAEEAPQAGPMESTGATEIEKDRTDAERPGFFQRLFGSKKNEQSDAASTEPAPSTPSAEETPQAGPMESTGATEIEKDRTDAERPGFFHRLFGSKKNKQSDTASPEPESAATVPTAAAPAQ